ncbi:MAG: hypothetical protein GQ549_08230 [Gammaproteobacteria bacterium]|nr:hypothetical protein [Gammaproteobacteria bacterium]
MIKAAGKLQAIVARHFRGVELKVAALFISGNLRRQISEKGLPQYGYTII